MENAENENNASSGHGGDDRLTIARQRMNGLCFPTLQSIACHTVLSNMEIASLHLNPIPDTLRQLLLKKLEMLNSKFTKDVPPMYDRYQHRFGETFSAAYLLAGPKCTDFWLDWLIVLCRYKSDKDHFSCKALEILATKAPHLQKLVIGRISPEDDNNDDEEYTEWVYGEDLPAWESGFGERLLAFKNLRSLSVNQALQPENLILLGENLSHLEYLSCHLDLGMVSTNLPAMSLSVLQEATLKMVGNMRDLKHFIFRDIEMDITESEWLTTESGTALRCRFADFCLLQFPQLETIGIRGELSLHKSQEAVAIPPNSQLKEITLFTGDPEMRKHSCYSSALPNISSLNLTAFFSDVDLGDGAEFARRIDDWFATLLLPHHASLLAFPKVQKLAFYGIPDAACLRVYLQTYGPKLTRLELCSAIEFQWDIQLLSLPELIALCPKLKELVLDEYIIAPGVTIAPVPPASPSSPTAFEALTTLHTTCFRPLDSILQAAPNLKDLTIDTTSYINQAEMQRRLSDLVKTKQVCTQITSLTVLFSPLHFLHRPTSVYVLGKVGEIVKDFCAFCPKLQNLNLALKQDQEEFMHHYRFKITRDSFLEDFLNMMDEFCFVHRLPE